MKIRKSYIIVIFHLRKVVTITKNRRWVRKIQNNVTVGVTIIDCNFNEYVFNIKILTNQRYYLHKRK